MPGRLNRRRFLAGVLGAVAAGPASVFGGVPRARASGPRTRISSDDYVRLGRTGMRVSRVAAGLSLGPEPLVASADAGINYFDTAEKYLNGGHTRMVGEALKRRPRSSIFVSAKFQEGLQNELTATADEVVARVHRCLERLGTDYIDCMLIHNVQRPEALTNPAWLAAYERLKREGKVRFLGASTHDPRLSEIVARLLESNRYDLMLVAFNPTTEGDLYGSRGWPALPRLLREAEEKDVAVSTMKIMIGAVAAGTVNGVEADGIDPNDIKGRGKYLEARIAATRWVLAHPGVHVVQYTMTGPETVRAAVTAATTPFAAGDVARARAHDERARGAGCPVPCPAPCQEACPAGVAVAEVLHHRTYAEHHGLRLQARLDYAALPPSRQARACVDCASQACVEACPESLPVKQLMRAAHRVLGPA